MAAVSSTIAALVLTTVSLWVCIGYSGSLAWIIIGSSIVTFTYSLGRYTQVVGRRNRVGVHMVWFRAPRVWRIFLIVCVVWGVAVIVIGDHVTLETPMVRDGHYVTTRYGHIVRYVSSSEYRDLKMGRFRDGAISTLWWDRGYFCGPWRHYPYGKKPHRDTGRLILTIFGELCC
jgi:hypothetical protein